MKSDKQSFKLHQLPSLKVRKFSTSVTRIGQTHSRSKHPLSLKNVIGDGFLILKSPVFLSVRRQTKELGFHFVPLRNLSYDDIPLLNLDLNLRKKQIPFLQNEYVLKKFKGLSKEVFQIAGSYIQFRNFSLHESSHAIANHSIRASVSKIRRLHKGKNTVIDRTFLFLLEESFASAVETLAMIDVRSALHADLLMLNSYLSFDQEVQKSLVFVSKKIGNQFLLRALLVSYLFSNYMYVNLGESEYEVFLNVLEVDRNTEHFKSLNFHLRVLLAFALKLNPYFRTGTNRVFLSMVGIKKDVRRTNVMTVLSRKSSRLLIMDLSRSLQLKAVDATF